MNWYLPALLALPLVGAIVVAGLRGNDRAARAAAMLFALGELVLAAITWLAYQADGGERLQLTVGFDWIPAFGTRFALGVDGIALVMIALIAVLVPIVLGASWEDELPPGRSIGGFFSLVLVLQALLVGVFAATDVFLFYVFFEAMLIPMYFLIGRFGGPRRQYAAVKFFLYSLLGGLVMLASVIGLFVISDRELPNGTFDWVALQQVTADLPLSTQIWLFLGFFIAFAIKAPLVPLHTWLPDTYTRTPLAALVLGTMLVKVGAYGFLRFCFTLFPVAAAQFAPLVSTLAVISILYGWFSAYGQRDIVRLIAYTSITKADTSTLALAEEHKATEKLLAESGVPHVVLRNGWYIENYTGQLATYLEHGIVGSAGTGKVSAAPRADFAEAAAAVLTQDGHDGAVYELGGEAFTMPELAATVSAATGRHVTYTDVPVEQYAQILVGAGLPEPAAALFADFDRAVADGEHHVGDDLDKLIGRAPTPLADAVAAAAARLQA